MSRERVAALADLEAWYASPLGDAVLEDVAGHLRMLLDATPGDRALVHGPAALCRALDQPLARFEHVWRGGTAGRPADLGMVPEALPLEAGTLDLLVLGHSLDGTTDRLAVLAEAERVLAGEGLLLLVDFNPVSLFGLRHWLPGGEGPFTGEWHYPGTLWLRHRLQGLGLSIEDGRSVFFRLPCRRRAVLAGSRILDAVGPRLWPGLGAISLILARKRVPGITPLRSRWREAERARGGLAHPLR